MSNPKLQLPNPLGLVYEHVVSRHPGQVRAYRSGREWGYDGPTIVVGGHPHTKIYLSLDEEDPKLLVVGRDPLWVNQEPDAFVVLADLDALDQLDRLLDGENPSAASYEHAGREPFWGGHDGPPPCPEEPECDVITRNHRKGGE